MATKKWIHYGWQTFLLCVVVSVSQPVLATATPPSSTSKDNARKPRTAKTPPASSTTLSKSTSSSAKTTARNQIPRKELPTLKKDKLTSGSLRETRRKLAEKCCRSTVVIEVEEIIPRKEKVSAQQRRPLLRAMQMSVEKMRLSDAKRAKSLDTLDRTNRRYVTVLKETKRQTMERIVIELPRTRVAAQSQHKNAIMLKTQQQSPTLAKQTERTPTPAVQEARSLVAAAAEVKPAAPAVSKSAPQKPAETQPVTSPLVTTSSPAVATPPVALPTSTAPPQQSTPQPTTTLSTRGVSQEAPRRADVASSPSPSPSPSPQPTTLALVEPSTVKTVATKEDQQPKEWSGYSPQKAPFAATVNDEPLDYRVNSLFVLPGDEIFLAVLDSQKRAEYTVRGTLGPERLLASRRWYWTAPTSTGLYQLKVTNARTNSSLTLNVFVMVPLDRVADGFLNGYRIGTYPTEPLRQLAMYNRPRGLIEVTPENENLLVSPHFRLRQFLCKQDGDYPKYIILDARLLTTLEQLLEMVNARGYRARTFSIMSGYRTPYYNRAIGNRTTYSRHLWGDAADIYIDEEPRDGKMDDLNEDGVIDAHDADVIYQLIETTSEPRIQKIMLGGLARYRETSSHGPFIHVDARGSYARWGLKTLTKGGTTRTEAKLPTDDKDILPSFLGTNSPDEDLR